MVDTILEYFSKCDALNDTHATLWKGFEHQTNIPCSKLLSLVPEVANIDCNDLNLAKIKFNALCNRRSVSKHKNNLETYLTIKHRMLVEHAQLKQKYYDIIYAKFKFRPKDFDIFLNTCKELKKMCVLDDEVIQTIGNKYNSKVVLLNKLQHDITLLSGDPIDVMFQIKKMCDENGVQITELELPNEIATMLDSIKYHAGMNMS